MNKATKITVIILGGLLVLNGIVNIIDDGRILTYDITSLLSGIGLILLGASKKL
jgi:hypothetical protein